ncbi:beta-ribofuranosylaminobenzene 5'-phosphate synthase family [Isosphaera pallida ATCC 43644]|uniref:Beta-ribofuranosylaminobenzene 5'-phosphate synthase family n=1 Tax=Isosphaera pallida (strain ATCC 43644 / DSM 9630 / IS1B) TaxID=575540 RepID=E8R3B0_ISOPI|nr:beta-ribofuranosylaminobenzene 5'-phosphate synthase family protein [Isosphaera pallida]ADV63620.1 beta-ribofuranosylaminobenzene 5'-phosphate synthase family [Isosphaera pallida ATCC 43644]
MNPSPRRVRIETGARLHFGLLARGPTAPRHHGGLGMMIDQPGLVLTAETIASPPPTPTPPHARTHAEAAPFHVIVEALASAALPQPSGFGSCAPDDLNVWAARLDATARRVVRTAGLPLAGVRLRLERAPIPHIGLGSGTQLGLAVACALATLSGLDPSGIGVATLARWSGRGLRSGVGAHGFEHGGLIVDGGHPNLRDGDRPETDRFPTIAPLLSRLVPSNNWRVILARPERLASGRHGQDEADTFARLPPIPRSQTDAWCGLVLLELLPAIVEGDLPRFGAALSRLQREVGDSFATEQAGGAWAGVESHRLAKRLEALGLVGVGQSSWGPTLYGFTTADSSIAQLDDSALADALGLPTGWAMRTRPLNQGARVIIEA